MAISEYEMRRYQLVVEKDLAKLREAATVKRKRYVDQNASAPQNGRTSLLISKVCSPTERSFNLGSQYRSVTEGDQRTTDVSATSTASGVQEYNISITAKPRAKRRNFHLQEGEEAAESEFCLKKRSDDKEYKDRRVGAVGVESIWTEEAFVSAGSRRELQASELYFETSAKILESTVQRRIKTASVWTRSLTEAMRGVGSSRTVQQEGFVNPRSARKAMETFVPWKKTASVEEQGRTRRAAELDKNGMGKTKGKLTSTKSGAPQSLHVPMDRPIVPEKENVKGPTGSSRKQGRQSTLFSRNSNTDVEGRPGVQQSQRLGNASLGGRTSTCGRGEDSTGIESRSKTTSTVSLRTIPPEIFTRNRERRFAVLEVVRKGRRNSAGIPIEEGKTSSEAGKMSSTADVSEDEDEFRDEVATHVTGQHQDTLVAEDEEDGEDVLHALQPQQEAREDVVGFCNDDPNDNIMTDNDNDEDALHIPEEDIAEDVDDEDINDLIYSTEAKRKKERRQERAWLEKEGDKRRKEGLPRNFLLVDEQTKMPYGVGVGDWRKELMLLSRDLDPAIGNINRQPEGAVAEIAEWIQHTWEYSSPVKFEYVKEVIARGVTLRRVDLWKKIRNGERKPSGMTDRTWRTLERQLENPASMRKSENCRKANASRVNFGRTGPSGEVGVRNRLRRILRRSPDPDEIRVEMARDKGYAGRQRREDNDVNVMQGSGRGLRSSDMAQICAAQGNLQEDGNNKKRELHLFGNESNEVSNEGCAVTDTRKKVVPPSVSSMSVEEISEHPFVAMMMRRLEALENREIHPNLKERYETGDDVLTTNDTEEGLRQHHNSQIFKDVGHAMESEGNEGSRTTGRQRKRAK